MVPAEEFRKYANACRHMADNTRDPEGKAIWNGLAERWDRCVALQAQRQRPMVSTRADKSRREHRPMYRKAS